MNFHRLAAAALAVLALGAGPARATSVSFDAVGDTASFVYNASVDGAQLSASVNYELTSWSGSTAVFHVVASNHSSGAGSAFNANRLVSFGVAVVSPDILWAAVPGLTEWDATANATLPGYGTVELCNYAGSTCAGGASLGVFMGHADSFDLTIGFASGVNATHPITFSSPFPSKWQSVGASGNSYEFAGCLSTDTACGGTTTKVPEPASLALAALGLLGVAAGSRRRRAASAVQVQQA